MPFLFKVLYKYYQCIHVSVLHVQATHICIYYLQSVLSSIINKGKQCLLVNSPLCVCIIMLIDC